MKPLLIIALLFACAIAGLAYFQNQAVEQCNEAGGVYIQDQCLDIDRIELE